MAEHGADTAPLGGKVGAVAGAVGAAAPLALIQRGTGREIILVDKNSDRARGVAVTWPTAPLSPQPSTSPTPPRRQPPKGRNSSG